MIRLGLLLFPFALLLPASARAQEASAQRSWTALGGVGNDFGWFGVQVEHYLSDERLSVFGGLGYTPEIESAPSGPAAALGVRGFTPGDRHRGLAELSITQVSVTGVSGAPPGVEGSRNYGPGFAVGYQFAAHGGLTAMIAAGAGYAIGLEDDVSGGPWAVLVNIGVGYTWR